MSKKNAWKGKVLNLLNERAMSSTELSERLGREMRYAPHARKITLVLRGDKRFRELEQVSVDSWLRAESHKVSLWGLLGQNYAFDYPYTSVSA